MATQSAFVVGSRFGPELRRADPARVDWAGMKTIGQTISMVDGLMLPTASGFGRPAYDHEALDSGEATEAAAELQRRGIVRARPYVVPALPKNPTSEQRRAHAYSKDRAAYAAGRQVQALHTIAAVEGAGGAPPVGGAPLYERVEQAGQRWSGQHRGLPIPFSALFPSFADLYDADSMHMVGMPDAAIFSATGTTPSPAARARKAGEFMANPTDYIAFLAAPVAYPAIVATAYIAAAALLGPVGIALLEGFRRDGADEVAPMSGGEIRRWRAEGARASDAVFAKMARRESRVRERVRDGQLAAASEQVQAIVAEMES